MAYMKRITSFLIVFIILLTPYDIYGKSKEYMGEKGGKLDIAAKGAVLIEGKTGKLLYEKDSHKHLYPASTTKILTALVALENGDLEEMVAVGNEIDMIKEGSSTAGLVKGERISLVNLLRGLLIPSGNDAAYTIAVYTARRVSKDEKMDSNEAVKLFVSMMNERAKKAGAKDSNFINPHGFHDEKHYSTAYDLGVIAREAMKNKTFREIVNTQYYEMPIDMGIPSLGKGITHKWTNTNELIKEKGRYFYKYTNGIKTGHTTPAGYCLVSYAKNNGLDLIGVILNTTPSGQWRDSTALLNYGFSNYQFYKVTELGKKVRSMGVDNPSSKDNMEFFVLSNGQICELMYKGDIPGIKVDFEWDKKLFDIKKSGEKMHLKKSISKDDIIGKATYSINGKTLGEIKLIADRNIKKSKKTIYVVGCEIPTWIIFAVLGLIIVLRFSKKRPTRRRR